MWICLNADRGLSAIRIEPQKIAAVLGKTEALISERWRASSSTRSASQQPLSTIQITDRFWPYEREPASQQAERPLTYVSQIKRLFLAWLCVRSAFAAAETK
jgi:hypothetical protein